MADFTYTAHLILHHRKDLVVVDLTLARPLIEKYHLETEIYQDVQAAGWDECEGQNPLVDPPGKNIKTSIPAE